MTKQQTFRIRHRTRINATQAAWRRQNIRKVAAHRIVAQSLKNGMISKPETCEQCSKPSSSLHAHHADYSKALEVIWLCNSCHSKLHGPPIVEKKNFAYGENHGRARLTRGQVMMIIALVKDGESKRGLARTYGVSEKLIRLICEGEIWKK